MIVKDTWQERPTDEEVEKLILWISLDDHYNAVIVRRLLEWVKRLESDLAEVCQNDDQRVVERDARIADLEAQLRDKLEQQLAISIPKRFVIEE